MVKIVPRMVKIVIRMFRKDTKIIWIVILLTLMVIKETCFSWMVVVIIILMLVLVMRMVIRIVLKMAIMMVGRGIIMANILD